MFRASEVFGRRPVDKTADKPQIPQLPAAGPRTRAWDPATGRFVEEEVPAEFQALFGGGQRPGAEELPSKRARLEGDVRSRRPQEPLLPPPSQQMAKRVLGPAAAGIAVGSGLAPETDTSCLPNSQSPVGEIQVDVPSVEYVGFSKNELNNRFYEKSDVKVHSRPTYWTTVGDFFIYWQGQVARWAICDSTSYDKVKEGKYPGWAYKQDSLHLYMPGNWVEAFNGGWQPVEDLEAIVRSTCKHTPQWNDPVVQKFIKVVQFDGFNLKDLNAQYKMRVDMIIQGRPSFWDKSESLFIYWQRDMQRWAICDRSCVDAAQSGDNPGWAYKSNDSHCANADGWVEWKQDAWVEADVETTVCMLSTSDQE